MKAIFASKMYAASKNKDKINAAINDPVNKELVLQLKEYLDDDTVDTKKETKTPPTDAGTDDKHVDEPQDKEPKVKSRTSPLSFNSGGGSSASDAQPQDDSQLDDDVPPADGEIIDDAEPQVDDIADGTIDDDSDDIDSSTAIGGESITASQSIDDLPSELKGTLNMRADTEGVSRVRIKENELWIHYNDSVNLNNVMGPVIELLNSANYSYLEFNRLARTENAIVFEVSEIDTLNAVEPVGGSEE